MISFDEQTIAAISTPPGHGGIAIVRMSGPEAIQIADKVFRGKSSVHEIEPWKAMLGKIHDGDAVLDEVVLIIYKAPYSYTKEDVVEISCHGGVYVSKRILELLLKHGARIANPGEFSFRAFMNGRLDLSQVEAVGTLIQSKTESSMQASVRQLEGSLSSLIQEIRTELMDSCSLLELELDFPEEDVEFVNRQDFIELILKIEQKIQNLIHTYKYGRIAREGVKAVIVGKPNVGKSSLLNKLLKEDRAIVTELPGTTRDVLEVQLDLNGILFRIFDTAGIAETENLVEKEGISRAKKVLESADIILHVCDASNDLNEKDFEIVNHLNNLSEKKIIRIFNKYDLVEKTDHEELNDDSICTVKISAKTGFGIDALESELSDSVIFDKENMLNEEIIITEVRHLEQLKATFASLQRAKEQAQQNVSSEFIALYLREALDHLGEITGVVSSEDILNNIFSRFCIGK